MKTQLARLAKVLAVASTLSLVACDKLGGKPDMKDAKAQYSYAIGVQIARNLKDQKIDLDPKAFSLAVEHVTKGEKELLTNEERMDALRKMSESMRAKETEAGAENLAKGQAFLDANKAKEGVKVTKSGLQYKVVTDGKGAKPKETDIVEVHYRGKLIDGKEFDSSYSRNEPAKFPVKAVIPGWTEALQLMNVGAKYELVIPAELAYGERGNPSIPPNSVLVFDVELLKIMKK